MTSNPSDARKRRKYRNARCVTCGDKGFVRNKDNEVFPCPSCNPDGAPIGEGEDDNY